MQRTFKRIALAVLGLMTAGTANATDISYYSAPFNARNSDTYVYRTYMAGNDVWNRIRQGFAMPDLDNERVTTSTEWYAARPQYVQRMTDRASRYLYYVVEELEKRNMPTELALLPFIESAFNPNAYSSAHASGMWQFIPATGKVFNLKQNLFTDERRDVMASTEAALNYLQRLHNMFGDWYLALAAYNWGEGSVQRAIRKNEARGLPTDYVSLMDIMPNETRNYVPKLQAVKNIIMAPDQYGVTLPAIENQPYFVAVSKTRNIDIEVAAQLAEMSLDEFKSLNPQFNRPVIIGGKDTQILLPENRVEIFERNLYNWDQDLSSWTAYTVQGAQVPLDAIARKFGTTSEIIRSVNNIPPNMVIRSGSTLLVPKSATAESHHMLTTEIADTAKLAFAPTGPETHIVYVQVKKNQTLARIASTHGVKADMIRSWNNLKTSELSAGQKLKLFVPVKKATKAPAKAAPAKRTPAPSQKKHAPAKKKST